MVMSYRNQRALGQLIHENSNGTSDYTYDYEYQDTLFDLVSSSGNFKSPSPQRFRRVIKNAAKGFTSYIPDNGAGLLKSRGVMLSVDALPSVSLDEQDMYTETYNKTLSKFNEDTRGKLDLSIGLFQAGQTARMFRAIGKVKEYIDYLKLRVKRNGIPETLGNVAGNARLSYQYGWKPLVEDIYDAAKQVMGPSALLRKKVRSRTGTTDVQYLDVNLSSVPLRVICRRSFRGEISGLFTIDPDVAQGWAGFTSLNPVSIAWELLPYSFVVDWFFNVGRYLRSVETALLYHSHFIDGYYTYTCRAENFISRIGEEVSSTGKIVYEWKGGVTERYKDRIALSSYPAPHFPQLYADLGSDRLLNAAALLSTFIGIAKK